MRNPIRSTKTKEYDLFLKILIESRKESGVGQRELGKKLDRTQSYVSKLERGDQRMDVIELVQYCAAIGVPAAHVILKLEAAIKTTSSICV